MVVAHLKRFFSTLFLFLGLVLLSFKSGLFSTGFLPSESLCARCRLTYVRQSHYCSRLLLNMRVGWIWFWISIEDIQTDMRHGWLVNWQTVLGTGKELCSVLNKPFKTYFVSLGLAGRNSIICHGHAKSTWFFTIQLPSFSMQYGRGNAPPPLITTRSDCCLQIVVKCYLLIRFLELREMHITVFMCICKTSTVDGQQISTYLLMCGWNLRFGTVYAIRLKYYTFCVQEEQKPCISTLPQVGFHNIVSWRVAGWSTSPWKMHFAYRFGSWLR